jgi:hypothetical protein
MRILELGPVPFVKSVYPEETTFVGIGLDPTGPGGPGAIDFGFGSFRRVRALLGDPSFDAIFVTRFSSQHDAVGPSALVRLANRRIIRRGFPALRIFGDRMLRFGAHAPIIVFDPSDAPYVPRHTLWLWQRAAVVFKRELPLDRWRVFMRTVHQDVPTPRFRRLRKYGAIVDKLRPMSLGLPVDTERKIPPDIPAKTTDLFFSGAVEGKSYLRASGLRELTALREGGGIVIDIAEERLSREAFFGRCGQAQLVWSPAGLGHDTFRHYEAAACGAVPLISRPPIEQYAAFRDGETAFFYDPEPGGLGDAIQRALARRDGLAAMGQAARAHVLARHSTKARVDHMLAALRTGIS